MCQYVNLKMLQMVLDFDTQRKYFEINMKNSMKNTHGEKKHEKKKIVKNKIIKNDRTHTI